MNATLQFPGESRESIGNCHVKFPQLLRLIGWCRRRRTLSVDKPQVNDHRLIFIFFSERPGRNFVPRSTDRKDCAQATFDRRSLLGTLYKAFLLSPKFDPRKTPSLSSHPPPHRKIMSLEVPGSRAPRVRGASAIVSDHDGYPYPSHHRQSTINPCTIR